MTALMWASANGHTESQKVLIDAGADVNIQTKVRTYCFVLMCCAKLCTSLHSGWWDCPDIGIPKWPH